MQALEAIAWSHIILVMDLRDKIFVLLGHFYEEALIL
jgi:hypothetical protein